MEPKWHTVTFESVERGPTGIGLSTVVMNIPPGCLVKDVTMSEKGPMTNIAQTVTMLEGVQWDPKKKDWVRSQA